MGTTELIWLRILLNDIELKVEDLMKMYCDNKIAINLANNPIMYDCTKYIEIDLHFIMERIYSKELILPYIKLKDQVTYIFTKGLTHSEP